MNLTSFWSNILILIGSTVLSFSIYYFRTLIRILNISTFIKNYKRIKIGFIFYQGLLIFFLFGYFFVFIANIIDNRAINNLIVGLLLLAGAFFVLLNILIQIKILNYVKERYIQTVLLNKRFKEEHKKLLKSNELLKNEILEHKQSEEEKARLKEQLLNSQKLEAIGQLAGGIAHDFNNMLSGISGYAQLIKWKYIQNNPLLEKYIDTILETSKKATDLTAQLLAFARKGKYQIREVDMHQIINNVVKQLNCKKHKMINIIEKLSAEEFIIMGAQNQLNSAVLNLAANAIDAMPNGGELTITTETILFDEKHKKLKEYEIASGKYLSISVKDTGTGIDEDTKARIFEPFFTTKEFKGCSGLGLPSVYGTVKNHNGAIDVISKSDKGSIFTIYLPLIPEQEKRQSVSNTTEAKRITNRILVVDRENRASDSTTNILRELDFSVTSCITSSEAIEYYQNNHKEIDLVILDSVTKLIDENNCISSLKKINPAAKIILSSDYLTEFEIDKNTIIDTHGYIQKPFNRDNITKVINEALEN